jgi:NAD(P)-dependent dehydrogenase (short-subunit alcohol dehydrogenase family)
MTIAQRLAGRTAIVTGAGAGIGRAIAIRLSQEGAFVACLDIDADAAAATAALLPVPGMGVACDVASEAGVEGAIASVVERRGGIDLLVNNAGIAGPQEPALSTPLDGWQRTLAVNLTGSFLMSRACLPALIAAKGAIVNVASALALVGWTDECAYGPSKAGVVQLTKGMAIDYAGRIRVNCVCPGAVRTPMLEATLPPDADVEATFAEYGKIHPLHQRLAWPEEIADVVLFLGSDDASLITGAALLADAGFTAG